MTFKTPVSILQSIIKTTGARMSLNSSIQLRFLSERKATIAVYTFTMHELNVRV